jgi:hypothetical protein
MNGCQSGSDVSVQMDKLCANRMIAIQDLVLTGITLLRRKIRQISPRKVFLFFYFYFDFYYYSLFPSENSKINHSSSMDYNWSFLSKLDSLNEVY